MAFAYAAGVITQTGTDTDLSGMTGLTGVTTTTIGLVKIYSCAHQLVVQGTMTIDHRLEMFVTSGTVSNTVDIQSGGVLNLGKATSSSFGSGGTIYGQGVSLVIGKNGPGCCLGGPLTIGSGGTLNMYESTINLNGVIDIKSGSFFNALNATLFSHNSDNNSRIRCQTGTGINIDGLTLYGYQFDYLTDQLFTKLERFLGKNKGMPVENALGTTGAERRWISVPDYRNSASAFCNNWEGKKDVRIFQSEIGTSLKIVPDSVSASFSHGGRIYHDLDLNIKDNSNVNILGCKVYIQDTDNGARVTTTTANSINETADRLYQETTDASGNIPTQSVLTGMWYRTNTVGDISAPDNNEIVDIRGKTNVQGEDFFDIHMLSYTHLISTAVNVVMNGLAKKDIAWTLFDDLSITETTKATVDAYTTLNNSAELYDRAKAYLYDNFTGETEHLVNKAGADSTLAGSNMIVNATAGSVFSFSSPTITIKSSSYTGGFNTTGTISQLNGAIINSLNLAGGATWNAIQPTWTGSAGATETIDVANVGDYDASGFVFDAATTLNNSSVGTVNIIINVGQQQPTVTGGTVNFLSKGAELTFSNLTSANVQILDDVDAVVERQISLSGSYVYNTPNGSSGTWKYIINRAGYDPIIFSYTANGSDATIDGTQTQKKLADGATAYTGSSSGVLLVVPSADGTRMNIRVGDGAVSAQNVFDETEDALQTQDGMSYLCKLGGQVSYQSLPTGTFVFLENNVRVIRDSAPDANATVNAFVQSTDGVVLDNTNGAVQFVTPTSDVNVVSVNGVVTTSIDDFKADISGIETKIEADARQVLLVAEHDSTQADIAALNDLSTTQIADAVWDEPTIGHTSIGSTGWSSVLSGRIIVDTTITGTPTATTIQLTAGSAVDEFYDDEVIYIASGAGAGQARIVTSYVGATKTITLDEPFVTTPVTGARVVIQTGHNHPITQIQSGLATSAEIATIETKIEADARQVILVAEHDQTQVDIAAIPATDLSSLETKVEADARQALLIAEHDATQVETDKIQEVKDNTDIIPALL